MDDFFIGRKDEYFLSESEDVSKIAIDSFCVEKDRYLLQLHRLISSFTNLDHDADVSDLTRRPNILRDQILEKGVLQNSDHTDTRKMMLV